MLTGIGLRTGFWISFIFKMTNCITKPYLSYIRSSLRVNGARLRFSLLSLYIIERVKGLSRIDGIYGNVPVTAKKNRHHNCRLYHHHQVMLKTNVTNKVIKIKCLVY